MTSPPLGDSFVHLHVHSEYSLLDGACRVDGLCRRSAEEGAPGIALTDHGVMFGAMEFYYTAREHSLVPIVGCEAYIAPRGRFDKTVRDEAHITLLAADLVGYRNLVALISKGFLEGYYYKPRIDMDLLAKHHDGLIVLSGCMSSLVAQPFLRNDPAAARKAAREFVDIFGDRFYIEIMRHGIPEQDVVNNGLIALAREMNLPLVATNDSHYLKRSDAQAHDVLLCIATGKTVQDTSRMKFMTDEFYVKSSAEMRELFKDVPDACDTTLEIVKRIDIKIPEKTFNIPHYPVPKRAERELHASVRAASDRLEAIRSQRVATAEPAVALEGVPPEISLTEVGPSLFDEPTAPSLFDVAPVHGVAFDVALEKRLVAVDSGFDGREGANAHMGEAGASEAGAADAEPDEGPAVTIALEVVADDDESPDVYLREICAAGLIARYGEKRVVEDAALRERLEYELDIILKMGFASYFLIVWDFIKFARDRGIPVGPGRGSAVGSLVSYALRITDMDPIKFDLIFERFLNPDRISMPDIDTDFCVERRDEVIKYVTEKYGSERVAQIVTFGTMAARAAVRDAGRALAVPLSEVDRVAKLIPSGPGGLSIEKALQQIPDLKNLYDASPVYKELLDTAKSIEGLLRHASTHAAGVVISRDPLVDWAPLVKLGDDDINTQYDMNWVERIGLLKMDFLGLRNLTVMKNAVDEIHRTTDAEFDLDHIPDDDKATLEMLGRGETTGVFQLESDGMRRVVTELKPSTLDDIVALVALYRPGPMDWIPQYISNKHGRTVPKYLHPKLVPILGTTYGVACLHGGTPIWYVSGMQKPIEEVRPGDEIWSYHGDGKLAPGRVAKMWPSGTKKLLRITLSTGTVIECSEDHRFPTPEGDMFARDLRPNRGAREMRAHYFYRRGGTMLLEAWPRFEEAIANRIGGERKAYLLGLLVGDGTLQIGTKTVTCSDENDAALVAALFRLEFGCTTKTYFHCRCWYVAPVFRSAPKRSALTIWLDEIYGGRSWVATCKSKRLPDDLLRMSLEERIGLLRGLWDSDGTYVGAGPYFRSTSKTLVDQVATLLGSLRIAFYVRDTAVFVQDFARFHEAVGRPWLPGKRFLESLTRRVMPVSSSRMRSLLATSLRSATPGDRRVMKSAMSGALMRVDAESGFAKRVPQFALFQRIANREMYSGETRPVYIDSIEEIGEGDCYDIQMQDQSNPYFIANGCVTHNCYQEQVMQIARDIAGFSMGQADELRKVMGKKQKEKIPVYREKFVKGAVATSGITEDLAGEIFAFVEPFAGYGFNKSHAVAYGWIAYQTAFLKANHPRAYLAALMTSVKDKTDKLVEYVDEAKKVGIAVLPPDVNMSLFDFTVVNEEIRFGLAAIKGVGEGGVRSIIDARAEGGAFEDVFDLVNRVDLRAVNRKVFEALVKCGALDTLPGNRAQKLDALDLAIDRANRAARDRESGQFSLFGEATSTTETRPALRNLPAPPVLEQLGWEKETLGIFVSGHPLADVQEALVRGGATQVKDLKNIDDDAFVSVAGMLIAVRRTITKAQQQMLIASIEDMTGSVECIVFPKSYPQLQGAFVQDAIVTIRGRVSRRERRGATPGDEGAIETSIQVNEVVPFVRSAPVVRANAWHVKATTRVEIDALARLLAESPGKIPVVIHSGEQAARMPRGISDGVYVRLELEAIFGRSGVWEAPL